MELQDVADCMDDSTTINIVQILSDLAEQNSLLTSCLVMWWASIGMCSLEVIGGITVLVFVCLDINYVRDHNYSWFKELGNFYRAYLILN